jgi:DNA-binding transcriptional regulator YiaG
VTLGDYIRKFRMDKGLLIKDLSRELGVTEDTVINWEVRGRMPYKKFMGNLANNIRKAL